MNEQLQNTTAADTEQEQCRFWIHESLDKTEKGGTANSIQNCVLVFENDPLFAGKISRNLLTETDDMIGTFPWYRDTTRFDDQDLPHVLLHFEHYYAFFESYTGDKLCSRQLYREALDHPYEEPRQWETREIFEIVNVGIANGSIQGWRAFPNSRRFEKYGTQRGWERVPPPAAPPQPVDSYGPARDEQTGFLIIDDPAGNPFSGAS